MFLKSIGINDSKSNQNDSEKNGDFIMIDSLTKGISNERRAALESVPRHPPRKRQVFYRTLELGHGFSRDVCE